MKKKIYYWSPCLNPVGTVISTINSSISLSKYSNDFEVFVINSCGEWDKYKTIFSKNNVNVIDFKIKFFKFLPKTGFFKSRFSYIVIFVFSFIPLFLLLKKQKPNYFIAHLITSLPIIIFKLFNLNTNLILRISGMPQLNFIRRKFWTICSNKINLITCPSNELTKKLIKEKIFNIDRIFHLPDAVLSMQQFRDQFKNKTQTQSDFFKNKKIFLAVGRLTKQKNFHYLIQEFSKFNEKYKNYNLIILGDGEEYKKLKKIIKIKKLDKAVFLLGRVPNVFQFMKNSNALILSSKWEEMGFVIIEAALSNLYIISSNCPNGPSEFLNFGKNGILFENGKENALFEGMIKFNNLDNKSIKKDLIQIKKNSMKFSSFRHFKILNKILNY